MPKELKIKYLVVPISILLIAIVTVILAVTTKNGWRYYLIGGALGLLTHGLMIKETARVARMAKDPLFNGRKSAILWFLVRMLVVAGVFVGVAFVSKEDLNNPDKTNLVIDLVITLAGYMTVKIVFIISVLILKKIEKKEDLE